jgi:hypothetical protein
MLYRKLLHYARKYLTDWFIERQTGEAKERE